MKKGFKMNANKDIKALITSSNAGKEIPALQLINNAPTVAATLSKLSNVDRNTRVGMDGNRTIVAPNRSGLSEISADIAQKATDNENVLQLFPELEQGLRILINSTMAPKDGNSTEINFSIPNNLKVSALSGKLLPIIEKILSKDLKLKETMPELLYQSLGIDGCYPMLVVPESSVDDMINDRQSISSESIIEHFGDGKTIHKGFGWIGDSDFKNTNKSKVISFEAYINKTEAGSRVLTEPRVFFKAGKEEAIDTLITVTDNINILKFPEIVKLKRQNEINRTLDKRFRGSIFSTVGLESDLNNPNKIYGSSELTDTQLTQLLYKNNPNIRNVTRKIKTSNETGRYNVGAPLLKKIPAEAVIPICMSSDKRVHVAYFILLDGFGNPLSKDSATSAYEDFKRNQQNFKAGSNNLSSHLLQRTADSFNSSCADVTYQQMQKVCSDIIETDFLSRLRNGIYGEDVALVESTVIYDIMLTRMFKEQNTQVLFVPAELMTYFAFKHRPNGTGKTLLEDSQVINTLRAVLMFANVNRAVINSIGRTEIDLTVDENDPNKGKTLEIAKHAAIKTRESQALPATISPTDINQYLKTSQMYFNITSVKGLPGTAVKFNETQSSYTKPDSELSSELDKKAILGLGVPPELVTGTEGIEFATNIVANNIRLNKQIIQIQDAFQPQISKLCQTYSMNHGEIIKEVEEVIRVNLKTLTDVKDPDELLSELSSNEEFLVRLLAREFVSNIQASFSRPDTVTLKNQMDAFGEYESAIDKALKYYLSEDILSEATSGTITKDQVGLLHNTIKAHFIREWLKKNTIMPELFDIIKVDENGKSDMTIFNSTSAHANALTVSITEFLKRVIPVAAAAERDMGTVSNGDEITGGPSASSGGGSSSSSSDSSVSDTTDEKNEEESGGSEDDLGGMPSIPGLDDF